MKRLSQPSGITIVTDSPVGVPVGPQAKIVRKAILVHSGPNGSPMCFYTGDYDPEKDPAEGDVCFDDARIKNIVNAHNAMISNLAVTYGGIETMPIGAFPALLDMHEGAESINKVIGRLTGLLAFEVMDVPGVGQNCSCVTAYLTFLGADTVEKVIDGRIYHLSIGIDEETDTLGETSAVITPAAPGAMLLKRGTNKTSSGDKQMDVKKLEAHKKKMAKLEAMKSAITGMTKKVTAANTQMKLTKKQGDITHRLAGLMKGGKITPAEFKKMDTKKLAALPEEHINTMMETFEAMEPKIIAGQKGSTVAIDFATIGKSLEKKQMKNLKSEIKGDFKRLGKKLKGSDDGEDEEKDLESESNPFEKKMSDKPEEDKKDLSAEEPKQESMVKDLGVDVGSEDYKNSSNELQSQIDELNTQIARLAGMVEELMTAEQEEGQDLEGAMDENTKDLEGKEIAAPKVGDEAKVAEPKEEVPAPKVEKDLAAEEGKEDEKKLSEEGKADEKKLSEDDKKAEDDKKLSEDEKKKLTEETKKALSKAKKKKG